MNEAEGSPTNSLVAAAHELKTPLLLMRQLSMQLAMTDDPVKQSQTIERIRLTSEKSLRLVDTLTKSARLDDAMFELEPVHLVGLCKEVVDELFPLTSAFNQKLLFQDKSRSAVVVGNRELIRSLLMGLIDNAVQYDSESDVIEVSTRISRQQVSLSVRDHGPTIDLAEFRKIRESLGKAKLPISARPLSSGLGLMIAGKFVSAMSGELSLTRHRSGGMTFTANLPISRQLSLLEE